MPDDKPDAAPNSDAAPAALDQPPASAAERQLRRRQRPPRKPAAFRQADLTRAAKGLAAAGVVVDRYEIDPTSGKIVIVTARGDRIDPTTPLDKWLAEHARAT
jgi:hypothetical protein